MTPRFPFRVFLVAVAIALFVAVPISALASQGLWHSPVWQALLLVTPTLTFVLTCGAYGVVRVLRNRPSIRRAQFSLRTMLVIAFGIVFVLGLRVGWSTARTNPVYLAVVCLSCAFLGAALVAICMPSDE